MFVCFVVLALGNVWATSPTHDETTHLAAGWSYLATGDFRLNIEHPPLVKLIAALPLPSRLPVSRSAWNDAAHDDRAQWRYARALFFEGANATAMFRAARTTLVLLIAPLFFVVIASWSKELWGGWWRAFIPIALFAFDPNFIAHTGLVTTDSMVALLICASAFFFWRCSRQFTTFNVAAVAFSVALAHVTKFSAVILWPALVLTAALGARRQLPRMMQCIAIAFATTIVVIVACYALDMYARGFSKALYDTLGRAAYLRGHFDDSGAGFRTYFLWTMLLKTPIVTLIAFVAAIWFCIRSRRRELVFLFVPAIAYFVVASAGSLNIGHRHILPVYPFLFVACGALPKKWLVSIPVAALSALFVFAPFTPMWANHLAYFNDLAGGPPGGSRYLIDSNLDWGQDLQRLGTWLKTHNVRQPIDLAYFGTADPRYYGIAFSNFSDQDLFDPCLPLSSAKSRIFAISVNELVRGRDGDHDAFRKFLRARNARLIGRAGMTIEIYDVAGAAAERGSSSAAAM